MWLLIHAGIEVDLTMGQGCFTGTGQSVIPEPVKWPLMDISKFITFYFYNEISPADEISLYWNRPQNEVFHRSNYGRMHFVCGMTACIWDASGCTSIPHTRYAYGYHRRIYIYTYTHNMYNISQDENICIPQIPWNIYYVHGNSILLPGVRSNKYDPSKIRRSKFVLKLNLTNSHSSMLLLVDESSWNFAQNTAVILPCVAQNFRRIRRQNDALWPSEFLRYLSLGQISNDCA